MSVFVFKLFWTLTVLAGSASGAWLGYTFGRKQKQREWDARDEQDVLLRRLSLIENIGSADTDRRAAAWN